MIKGFQGKCHICDQTTEVRNINLYTIGSEGTNVCQDCDLRLVDYVNVLKNVVTSAKKEGFKIGRGIK